MSYNWDDGITYLKIPEGGDITIDVIKVEKATGKYNLKKAGEDLGFYIKVTTKQGILSINSWGLYFAFKNAFVKEGKTYNIKCLSKGGGGKTGEYIIKEIPKQEEVPF